MCPRLVPWPEWAVYRVTETWCGFGARGYIVGDSFERAGRTQWGSLSPCPFKAEMPHLNSIFLSETRFSC